MISSSHPTNAAEITSASLYAAIKETLQSGKEPKYRDEDENDAGQRARTSDLQREHSMIMDQLLSPVHTKSKSQFDEEPDGLIKVSERGKKPKAQYSSVTSPEDALEALRSNPDHETLNRALRWLDSNSSNNTGFNVRKPSPKSAQIVFVLVNDILPNYWAALNDEDSANSLKIKHSLLHCISSVAGIGAVISYLRLLLDRLKESVSQNSPKAEGNAQSLRMLLEVLEQMLRYDNYISSLWRDIWEHSTSLLEVSLQWKEVISLFASGKLLSIVSEANRISNDLSPDVQAGSWIGDGKRYSAWIGKAILSLIGALTDGQDDGQKAASKLLGKAIGLGYPDDVVAAAFSPPLSGDFVPSRLLMLMTDLSTHEQKTLLFSMIRILSRRYLIFDGARPNSPSSKSNVPVIDAVAAVIAIFIKAVPSLKRYLIEWLVSVSADAVGHNHITHRAIIAALSLDQEYILTAFEKALDLFSDKLFIKHTPLMHQEVNAQILLLLAGYVYRADKVKLVSFSKSGVYLNGISNHLAASSPRARVLGMFVGTAVSELVDSKDKRLTFSTEMSESTDAKWYQSLINVEDRVGSSEDLQSFQAASITSFRKPAKSTNHNGKSKSSTVASQSRSKVISIEEITDGSESEVDDLPMYEKPDSDPSDDDEDPTLVQRNKPTAPVYIRDLLAGLRDTENFDRHNLALRNAAVLIRRKGGFGTEVSDNIEELATILVGLQDKWDIQDFNKLRLQAMIAVLIAQPLEMGQWYSRTFYNGEYSLSQRASILTTLGLGARELAGLGKEDAALTGSTTAKEMAFPSKKLPDKLHKLYALEAAPLDTLSSRLEKMMIQPLAAEAADKVTGPNIFKVRTFSSRMEVEKNRQKPISNSLAKVVAEGFFFPLTGRWRIQLQAFGDNTPQASPHLLPHFLKTLSLILHASGRSLSLPQMTTEFWDLLLSLRPRATEAAVLEALLFSFLTLLDSNAADDRRLAEEHAKALLETQGWVEGVFERLAGGSEEGDRVRMLAAGVLVRAREVVEKHQRLLLGDLVDFV